ncbi:MAG: hypothetical protein AB7E52_06925, partial [Bdellovibrionales bacterium]
MSSPPALFRSFLLLSAFMAFSPAASADPISMLPPTEMNSETICAGSQTASVLVYTGDSNDVGAGINCAPVTVNSNGDLTATRSLSVNGVFAANSAGDLLVSGGGDNKWGMYWGTSPTDATATANPIWGADKTAGVARF